MYPQLLQIGRPDQALILLGLALCLQSECLCIFGVDGVKMFKMFVFLRFSEWSIEGLVFNPSVL